MNLCSDDIIIKMYKEGHSIDFITEHYYNMKNKDNEIKTIGNDIIISKNRLKKDEARFYVVKVIYNNMMTIQED